MVKRRWNTVVRNSARTRTTEPCSCVSIGRGDLLHSPVQYLPVRLTEKKSPSSHTVTRRGRWGSSWIAQRAGILGLKEGPGQQPANSGNTEVEVLWGQ